MQIGEWTENLYIPDKRKAYVKKFLFQQADFHSKKKTVYKNYY